MLIIEGPDNTGKDTLIEGIRRHATYRDQPSMVIHNGQPPNLPPNEVPRVMHEVFMWAYHSAREFPGYAIINRGHFSGAVYDHSYRGAPLITELFPRQDESLDANRDVVLLLTADAGTLLSRDDGLSTYTSSLNQEDALHAIAVETALFHRVAQASHLPCYIIDTSRSPSETLSQALTVLDKHVWGG